MDQPDSPRPPDGGAVPVARGAARGQGAWLGAPRGSLGRVVRGAVSLVLWFWLAETALALAGRGGIGTGEVRGRLLALFLGAAWAAIAGLAFGALVAFAPGSGEGETRPVAARVWAWCWERDAGVQRERVASVLAVAWLVALVCVVGFTGTRAIVIGIARPHFTALAILALYLALALACALLWSAARGVARWKASVMARLGVAAVLVRSAGALLACLAVVALLGVGALALVYRASLAYLPWRTLGAIGVGGVAALAWSVAAYRLPPRVAAVGRGLALLLLVASAAVAAGSDRRDASARRVALGSLLGGAGYAATEAAFDFDRDGALGFLGGGDCAPFDRRRAPSAIDVPKNGIDEDCDGADLGAGRVASIKTRRDWPVPNEVPKRPPIVLLTIDTFAAATMGALGGRHGVTPNLDALAARSALFTRCFSQGPSTRLSFPSLFTSRFDSEIRQTLIGGHPYPIDASEDLLAEMMQRNGYDTVAVLPDAYFGKQRWASLTQGFRTVIDRPYATRPQPAHNGALVTDAAIEMLGRRREQPLFLWAHYYDAHSPHAQPEGIEPRGTGRKAVYEAELKYVDREVGRLLAAVEARLPDALVVVTADHGIAFDAPRHERLNYGYDLHTPILHVPLIVRAPFVPPRRLDGLVATMDVLPTLANLLRVRGRGSFRGASLVPELLEGRSSRPPTLLHEFFLQERLWKGQDPLEVVALRTAQFNLIHDRRLGSWELYDWTHDYEERDDLSGRGEYAAVFDGLKQQLSLLTYEVHRGWEQRAAHAEAR